MLGKRYVRENAAMSSHATKRPQLLVAWLYKLLLAPFHGNLKFFFAARACITHVEKYKYDYTEAMDL
jgi:hypothetical protein